jgi:hypothetical protein
MRTFFPTPQKILSAFRLCCIVGILGCLPISQALAQTYQISLITCDPGDELYSTFGHSAIRVLDTDSGRDLVFNYGTFDFNTPFFYVKFTRRTLDYQLALTTFEQFLYEYNYFKRSVREQVLDLNPQQTNAIVDFLRVNYEPENRKYRYDFFYDNCSTRIRDMMETVLGENLKWNEPTNAETKTFRNLIDEYVYPLPWSDLGIDLALGAVIDQDASEREKLFLPDYLSYAFDRATIVGDGPSRSLIREENIIYDFPERAGSSNFLLSPYFLFWMLAILFGVFTYIGFKRKRLYLGLDIGLLGVMGILGILVVYLWFFTAHSQTKSNWNILWAFPPHLVGVYGLVTGKVWIRKYLLASLILADVALVFWIFGIQSFHPSILPLLLALILRTNFLYYHVDKWKPEKALG